MFWMSDRLLHKLQDLLGERGKGGKVGMFWMSDRLLHKLQDLLGERGKGGKVT